MSVNLSINGNDMRPSIINDGKLLELIDVKKLNQAQAARRLGVTRQAVNRRLIEIRGKTTKVVAAKKIERVVDQKLNAMDQLRNINDSANEILDLVMGWIRGEDDSIRVLESQVKKIVYREDESGKDKEIGVKEIKFKDPRELALKAMAEIRGQLKLQLDIFQALFSLQAAEEFQNIVLEIIGEVDPSVRNEIIHRLNAKRAIRSAVKFN